MIFVFLLMFGQYSLTITTTSVYDGRDMFPAAEPGESRKQGLSLEAYPALYDRTVNSTIVPIVTCTSLSTCSLYCLRYYCLSLIFKTDTKECILVHEKIYNIDKTIPAIRTTFYHMVQRECPSELGFVYYPSQKFCVKLVRTREQYSNYLYRCLLDRAASVRVDNSKKLNILKHYIDSQGFTGDDDWFFIESKLYNGEFTFDDNIPMTVFDWTPGRPDGGNHIVIGGNNQQFDDRPDTEYHYYICERPMH